jgi:hypothetical protein
MTLMVSPVVSSRKTRSEEEEGRSKEEFVDLGFLNLSGVATA